MKELDEYGREVFDGRVVALYETRFTGAIMLEPEDGAGMATNDQVTFIVTARVAPPKFSQVKKTGEYKRVNSLKLEEAVPIDPDIAAKLYDELKVQVGGVNNGPIEDGSLDEPEEEKDLGFDPLSLKFNSYEHKETDVTTTN